MKFATIEIDEIKQNAGILKPNYHLNEGKLRIMNSVNNGLKFSPLNKVCRSVYSGGIFKRMFVEKENYGIPYISAQHMMSFNPKEDSKLISKKFTPRQNDMTLVPGQILVSCAGTVGNVRLITEEFKGIIGSQDIIRIVSESNKMSFRFLYAYLSTQTVYSYIQSFIYGSVVPRIEPKTLEKLPIPTLGREIEEYVEERIKKVEELRFAAINNLKEAQGYFDKLLNYKQNSKYKVVDTKSCRNFQSRLDASYNIQYNEISELIAKRTKYEVLEPFIEQCFIPNRGKRLYTKRGLRYLSSSEIFLCNPLLVNKYISSKTPKIESMKVEKDWIIIARSGQEILGSTQLVGRMLNGLGVNEHGLRLIVKSMSPKYLFAFLSSEIGKQYLRAGIFGSAILTIDDSYIKKLRVPILSEEKIEKVIAHTEKYIEAYDQAAYLEFEAITKIEEELSSWQK